MWLKTKTTYRCKIGDFLETSATLLEIKSRKLLPKPEVEVPEEDDPEKRLIARLEEYKLFKEKSETLQALDDMGKFYKAPEPDATGYRYELPKDLSFDKLLDAFAQIMHKIQVKAELPEPKKIVKDQCPSCGAPIVGAVDENYKCSYCGNTIIGVIEKK